MKNPNIAKVLKAYRKLNHFSINDLVMKLEDYKLPVAPKTIYGKAARHSRTQTLCWFFAKYIISKIFWALLVTAIPGTTFFSPRKSVHWCCIIGKRRI